MADKEEKRIIQKHKAMKHYTLAELTTALRRFADAALRLAPPRQDPEIVDVDYEDITDVYEEEPGEESYCVPI